MYKMQNNCFYIINSLNDYFWGQSVNYYYNEHTSAEKIVVLGDHHYSRPVIYKCIILDITLPRGVITRIMIIV